VRRRGHLPPDRRHRRLHRRQARRRLAPRGRAAPAPFFFLAGTRTRTPQVQETGAARLKAGRSDNARRTASLSCSDKLNRWAVAGLQGAVVRHVAPAPLFLATVSVARQPRATDAALAAALARALVARADALAARVGAAARPPAVAVVAAGADRAARRATAPPSSVAVAWWRGARAPDVLVAHRGVLRGATAAAVASGRGASRVSTAALFDAAAAAVARRPPKTRPAAFDAADAAGTKARAPRRAVDAALGAAVRAPAKRPRDAAAADDDAGAAKRRAAPCCLS